jgi:DNA-binding NtrC family response regulator
MSIILIVDDNETLARFTSLAVESGRPDARAVVTNNGTEARVAARRERPDVAFIDRSLPDVDGLVLGQELMDRYPGLEVVMMTGASGDDLERRVAEGKVSGLLRKPFAIEDVGAALTRALGLAQERRERPRAAEAKLPEPGIDPGAEARHRAINQLSALLADLRLFAAELGDVTAAAGSPAAAQLDGLLKRSTRRIQDIAELLRHEPPPMASGGRR